MEGTLNVENIDLGDNIIQHKTEDKYIKLDEEIYMNLKNYISNKVYPPGYDKAQKRRLRQKAISFLIVKDFLYHKSKGAHSKLGRVIFDKDEQKSIIKSLHDGIIGGCHFGQTATIAKVTDRYWWPCIAASVQDFIRTCASCQIVNLVNKPGSSSLHPIKVTHIFH
ncbi:zinc finger and BTB domain-containing protein 11-like [Hydra vulgaris]|uniref:Zinc finger and BTB domain-containing protein 11-like n=1 Tax=Hydra vulgaris TaxID=6087 RepID=A0ABM4DMP6_HYDVU